MRDSFYHRGRVCCSWGRSEGVTAFATGVAFHIAWEGYVMFSCVRGDPGRCVTCAESSDELKFPSTFMYVIIV